MRFQNIHLFGKHEPKFFFEGYDNEHQTRDITVENVFWNGKLIKEIKEENFILKDHTKNIVYKTQNNEG